MTGQSACCMRLETTFVNSCMCLCVLYVCALNVAVYSHYIFCNFYFECRFYAVNDLSSFCNATIKLCALDLAVELVVDHIVVSSVYQLSTTVCARVRPVGPVITALCAAGACVCLCAARSVCAVCVWCRLLTRPRPTGRSGPAVPAGSPRRTPAGPASDPSSPADRTRPAAGGPGRLSGTSNPAGLAGTFWEAGLAEKQYWES